MSTAPQVHAASQLDPDSAGSTASGSVNSGVGEVLALFRSGRALTRAEVMSSMGLSRTTVNQRLDQLLQARLIAPAGEDSPTRGRPATRFAFNAGRGVLLVADLGATGMRAAVCDLNGVIASERQQRIDITTGPEAIIGLVEEHFAALLAETGTRDVHGIGLSVPGPVDFARGSVVNPPIMTGWDGYDIRGRFARTYDCPCRSRRTSTRWRSASTGATTPRSATC